MNDRDWWSADHCNDVTVTGKGGAVRVTHFRSGEAETPSFDFYEKVAYVARGTVNFFLIDLADEVRGHVLPEGSFFRVPPTLIHWVRNSDDSLATIVTGLVESRGQAWGEPLETVALAADWEHPTEFMDVRKSLPADPHQYALSTDDEQRALNGDSIELVKVADDVSDFGISNHLKVPLRTKIVFGRGVSIMVAERPGAYHSTPHVHAAEQINAVIRGSNWAYCLGPNGEHTAVETDNGSIFRFPTLAPHWAWGRDGSGSKVVEFHFPGLHGDPDMAAGAVSLIATSENLEPATDRARNVFVDNNAVPVKEIESVSL